MTTTASPPESKVASALDDTTLEVRDGNGVLLAANDDWTQSPSAADIQSVGLAPASSAESAVMLPLVRPGNYTAILRGKNNTTGIGLVEIYNLP